MIIHLTVEEIKGILRSLTGEDIYFWARDGLADEIKNKLENILRANEIKGEK